MTKIQEMRINRFLKEDLEIEPKYAITDTLKKIFVSLDENIENKHGILNIDNNSKKITRQINYFIDNNHTTVGYKRVIKHNDKLTPKNFVVTCYEFYRSRYI
jgi:hypothetical protein